MEEPGLEPGLWSGALAARPQAGTSGWGGLRVPRPGSADPSAPFRPGPLDVVPGAGGPPALSSPSDPGPCGEDPGKPVSSCPCGCREDVPCGDTVRVLGGWHHVGPGEKGGHVRISGDGSMLGTSSWVAALQPQHPGGPLWDRSGGRLLPMGCSPCSAVRLFLVYRVPSLGTGTAGWRPCWLRAPGHCGYDPVGAPWRGAPGPDSGGGDRGAKP